MPLKFDMVGATNVQIGKMAGEIAGDIRDSQEEGEQPSLLAAFLDVVAIRLGSVPEKKTIVTAQ